MALLVRICLGILLALTVYALPARAGFPQIQGAHNTGTGTGEDTDDDLGLPCGPKNPNNIYGSAPVNGFTGQLVHSQTFLFMNSRGIPLKVKGFHQTQDTWFDAQPALWRWNIVFSFRYHQADPRVYNGRQPVIMCYPNGRWCTFETVDDVRFTPAVPFGDNTDSMVRNPDGSFDLLTKQGTRFHFIQLAPPDDPGSGFGDHYLISSIRDRNGNQMTWNYSQDFRILSITDAAGRSLEVAYGSTGGTAGRT